MENREMLMELKRVKPMMEHIKRIAHEMIENTFDYFCYEVDSVIVRNEIVEVLYVYRCHGEYGHESVCVPIEWFDEGFDYRSAYEEMKRKEHEEEQKRIEAE